MHDYPGKFWHRRGQPITCLDEASMVDRLRYCLANSTKEGLVSRPTPWPGAHSAKVLCEGQATGSQWREAGEWIDRSALFRARKRKNGAKLTEADFAKTVYISKLP